MRTRLRQILLELDLSQKDFAELIKASPSRITEVLSGRTQMLSGEALREIYKKFNIDINWLLTGKGEMFLKQWETSVKEERRDYIQSARVPGAKELIEIYQAVNVNDRKEILEFADFKAKRAGIKVKHQKGKESKVTEVVSTYSIPDVKVPLIGNIAAGKPIYAKEHFEGDVSVPQDCLHGHGPFFALRIKGESMIGAGIVSGDIGVFRSVASPRSELHDGDIVTALIENEATLKRIFLERNDDLIELRAENPEYKPMILVEKDAAMIQGKLLCVIRKIEEKE